MDINQKELNDFLSEVEGCGEYLESELDLIESMVEDIELVSLERLQVFIKTVLNSVKKSKKKIDELLVLVEEGIDDFYDHELDHKELDTANL